MTDINMGESISWWTGKVVNIFDPQQSGRVQVRVFGRHDDEINIPDSSLPWALVLQPTTSAAIGKIGQAPVGLVPNSNVVGIWLDHDHQYPLIIGSIGKAGDPIPNVIVNGAPAVNTSLGSIPGAAQGYPNNPYALIGNPKFNTADIAYGNYNIFSIAHDYGVSITKKIEDSMPWAKLPTIVSIPPGSSMDVSLMSKTVDPLGLASALPCFPMNFFTLENLLGMLSELANLFKQMMISAIRNALLKLMKKLGLYKVLNLLNQIAQTIQELQDLLKAFAQQFCGINILNQGLFGIVNYGLAAALYDINSLTGFVIGAADSVNQAALGLASGVFDGIVTYPLASIATSVSAKPSPSYIVNTPPNNYVKQYYADSDPYPGYIVWVDPQGETPPVYTLRNGEPNFTSSQQQATYIMDNAIMSSLEQAIISGNLNASTLTSITNNAFIMMKNFAISSVLGVGFSVVNGVLGNALAGSITALNMSTSFTPQISQAYVVAPNASSAMSKFAANRSVLHAQQTYMKTALG